MNAVVTPNPIRFTLQDILDRYGLDALWIKSLLNIKYQVGFTGSTANLLITRDGKRVILVDGRYTTQAKEQCRVDEVREIKKPLEDLAQLVRELGCKNLGFEALFATFADHRALGKELQGVTLVPVDENLAQTRIVKTAEELEKLRKANEVSHKVWLELIEQIKPGWTENQVAWFIDRRFRELGSEKVSFDTLVCSGPRSAIVHGAPSDKKIDRGEFLIIDRGCQVNHYVSDETNTLVLGRADEKQKEIYAIVKEAHDRCVEAVKPGAKCQDLDAIAREIIDKKGYSAYFGHGTGHGVGIEVHEQPVISPRGEGYVEEGMVFSVEPGIYIPDWGGVRIEDVVAVTRDGCEILTRADKSWFELEV